MIAKDNVTIGIEWRFGPDWPGQRCGAKTRRGTACQRPANKGNGRCRLHGGASSGPRTEQGRAKIALAAAGLKRQVVSKVWNKDQFRLSVVFEYSSKDAFEKCREIFGELERSEFMNKFAVKFQNNRGIVVSEFEA